jgi:cytochrome c oxidase assembly protein subunit 15
MLIVLLMGARVTSTGSGEGCGSDWPLCHGNWVPQNTYESITEYSHRIVTGAEGLLVAATAIAAWPLRHRYRETLALVPLMAGTLVFQSLMGAAAVKWPQSPKVMATHFGISLLCLAAAALLALVLMEDRPEDQTISVAPDGADRSKLRAYKWLALGGAAVAILVAYSGAYVRHTGAELACTSWPTCNGKLIPDFGGIHGIHTTHRLMALLITVWLLVLFVRSFSLRTTRPELFRASAISLGLVLLQSLIGLIVIETGLALMATLAHALGMSVLFVVLCEATRLSWRPTSSDRVRGRIRRSHSSAASQLPGTVA